MNILKNVDLTTPQQKALSVVLIALGFFVLYLVTPPLVVLFKNLVLLAIYGGTLLMLFFFMPQIWHAMNLLSWNLTKKMVSSDPVWHLKRGVEHMQTQAQLLSDNLAKLKGVYSKLLRDINANDKEIGHLSLVVKNEQALPELRNRSAAKLTGLDDSNKKWIAQAEALKKQIDSLDALYDAWVNNINLTTDKVQLLEREYETMQTINAATSGVKAFLSSSPEMSQFNLAVNEAENFIYTQTASFDQFSRELQPMLSSNQMVSEDLLQRGLEIAKARSI